MNRNEYRRAFIMLRAALPGYGGHVRLERRTMTGSMYFIVTAPQADGALHAALAGQRDGAYYAASLGELTRDRRGQLTLARSFDPRNIDGRPLEAYAWVVVARDGAPCAVALTGNVEGSRPMDIVALGRAVEALLNPEQPPAGDLPEPEEAPSPAPALDSFIAPTAPEGMPESAPETTPACMPERAPESMPESAPEAAAEDIRIYTGSRALQAAQAASAAPDPAEAPAAQEGAPAEAPAEEGIEPPTEAPVGANGCEADGASAGEADGEAARTTAARQLGLDITRPWPGAAEQARRLFATQPPAQGAPEDGFTYVRAPMPPKCGYAESLIGLAVRDGQITGMRCALPGQYAPEPPAGLEGYTWTGEGGEGHWVTDQPL